MSCITPQLVSRVREAVKHVNVNVHPRRLLRRTHATRRTPAAVSQRRLNMDRSTRIDIQCGAHVRKRRFTAGHTCAGKPFAMEFEASGMDWPVVSVTPRIISSCIRIVRSHSHVDSVGRDGRRLNCIFLIFRSASSVATTSDPCRQRVESPFEFDKLVRHQLVLATHPHYNDAPQS
jgi:hypothetical protein